jgi:hypothetical protein
MTISAAVRAQKLRVQAELAGLASMPIALRPNTVHEWLYAMARYMASDIHNKSFARVSCRRGHGLGSKALNLQWIAA